MASALKPAAEFAIDAEGAAIVIQPIGLLDSASAALLEELVQTAQDAGAPVIVDLEHAKRPLPDPLIERLAARVEVRRVTTH